MSDFNNPEIALPLTDLDAGVSILGTTPEVLDELPNENQSSFTEVVKVPRLQRLKAKVVDFGNKSADSLGTFNGELLQPEDRAKRIGAVALGTAAEASALARVMIWTLPPAFEKVLSYSAENGFNGYQQGALSGLVIGGMYGAWAWGAGKLFKNAADKMPHTVTAITQNHPALVGTIENAISGFPSPEQLKAKSAELPQGGYEYGPYEAKKSRFGKIALAPVRGLKTLFLFGPIPYVGIAKVRNYSDKSIDKLLPTVSAEGAATVGGIAVGLSALVTHDVLGLADEIKDVITNEHYLLAATTVIILWAGYDNYKKRQKYQVEVNKSS